jgi:uncharacterized membrane protein
MAKSQIKGNIGTLFVCLLIMGVIAATGIGALLVPALNIGLIATYLRMTRGIKPGAADVFSRLETFGKALWLNIITVFFVYLWMILLIIPGIIKAIAYSLAPYVLADNPTMTARDALNASKQMTKGHIGELFVLELSFIPWAFLVGITFGIAAIWVAPYIQATLANYYNELKRVQGIA